MSRLRIVLALAIALLAAGCASLPAPQGRIASVALTDTTGTRLAAAVAPGIAANPGKTGVHPLFDPRDAFAARVLLANAAEKSIDVQYYIWHDDEAGMLLLEALWGAAERGVRIRLLLDDMNTRALDATIAALDAHPNVEVRLYNPFVQRGARMLAFLTDFARLNRRMHNKSFTVDNQVTVVGGRNIGNEYFGLGDGIGFADLDVAVAGVAVPEVSRQFDLYWNSSSAYASAGFTGPPEAGATPALLAKFRAARASAASVAFMESLRSAPFVRELLERRVGMEWMHARLVHDDPAKTLDTKGRTDILLFPALIEAIGRPRASFDLVSPYFVPGDQGTAALAALARGGTRVRVVTNSLASSESAVVFSGYSKRRHELLRAGVRLFELRPVVAREGKASLATSSSTALHAKTFAVDGARVFVGSFNFDLRSAQLNTELGLVLESPLLAARLARVFDDVVPLAAYEVRLRVGGEGLEWIERTASGEVRHETEPGTGFLRRLGTGLLETLAIDWML